MLAVLESFLERSEGDVAEARERGADPGDEELLRWAAGERRILVTLDKDFGELIFTQGVAHGGLVRLPDETRVWSGLQRYFL